MRIISGSAKGRKLKSPDGTDIRPTSDKVREALFDILGPSIVDANFLDLFAGSGGIGLEALSRRANVTMVEKSPAALSLLKENLAHCKFKEKFQIVSMDSLRFVRQLAKFPHDPAFDFIFADPPYDSPLANEVLSKLSPSSLASSGLLIIEHNTRRKPSSEETLWEKKREAIYGKTALSFYKPELEKTLISNQGPGQSEFIKVIQGIS